MYVFSHQANLETVNCHTFLLYGEMNDTPVWELPDYNYAFHNLKVLTSFDFHVHINLFIMEYLQNWIGMEFILISMFLELSQACNREKKETQC